MIDLKLGCCIDEMKKIAENTIDLTVTSPPYDNLRTYNNASIWNETKWKSVLCELFRITKLGGVVVWVVSDQTVKGDETGTSFKQALYAKECGFNLHDTMIYLKDGICKPDKKRYQQSFEFMFVFSKGTPCSINLLSDRRNKSFGRKITGTTRNKDGSCSRASGYGNKIKQYGIRWNTWEIKSNKGNCISGHPAMFPEELARDHIISWSKKGDHVLDPFLGSGTTGIACLKTGRDFTGIEISEEYFKIAEARIKHYDPDTEKEETVQTGYKQKELFWRKSLM